MTWALTVTKTDRSFKEKSETPSKLMISGDLSSAQALKTNKERKIKETFILFHAFGKGFKKVRNRFNAFVKIEQTVMLIGRVYGIAVKPEAHKNRF